MTEILIVIRESDRITESSIFYIDNDKSKKIKKLYSKIFRISIASWHNIISSSFLLKFAINRIFRDQ